MRLLLALLLAQPYGYYISGNAGDVRPRPQFGMLLGGGAGDEQEAYRWLLRRSGGGDVVVLRASGTDSYNQLFFGLAPVDSVETLVITNPEAAGAPEVTRKLAQAEAIFLAGGDQWNYIRLWRNGPIGEALNQAVKRGVPIGGTSAGLAVLGEYSFSAEFDTVHSSEALANPFDRKVAIATDLLRLPHLTGVITDSHFSARDRMGRLLVFLARIAGEKGMARGIGIDEGTAVTVDAGGAVQVLGTGSAYFVELTGARALCRPGVPLSAEGVKVYRAGRGASFNLKRWQGDRGEAYTLSVAGGIITSSKGPIY